MNRHTWLLVLLVACTGSIEDGPGASETPPVIWDGMPPDGDGDNLPDVVVPAASGLRRLTQPQYLRSVRALTGIDLGDVALEPDTASNGFVSVGSARTTISARGVEQYEDAAYAAAAQLVADEALRQNVAGCDPTDAACYGAFIRTFGRRAWRRPLTDAEVLRWEAVAEQASSTLGDPWAGIEFAVAGLLQSPHFLFRPELGSGPSAGEHEGAGTRYDDWEMASRVAFTICNQGPDDALLDAAAAGELTSDEGLRAQVERLVGSDCANVAIRGLFDELLDLGLLPNKPKDQEVYPAATETLGGALRESLLRTVAYWAVDEDVPYPEFFTRNDAWVNAEVAAVYEAEFTGARASTFERIEADSRRGGLLTHPAVPARYAHPEATSPTLRGKFVRTNLLCRTIPAPPDDVGELPEPSPGLPTLRERLAAHRENPACAGCHQLMDPIGLSLENFDGVGMFRTEENGAPIDSTGELDGVPFDDAIGLGHAVADHPSLMSCMVRNAYRYATGHIETAGEARTILLLTQSFEDTQQLRQLLVELVMSEGFRSAGAPQ